MGWGEGGKGGGKDPLPPRGGGSVAVGGSQPELVHTGVGWGGGGAGGPSHNRAWGRVILGLAVGILGGAEGASRVGRRRDRTRGGEGEDAMCVVVARVSHTVCVTAVLRYCRGAFFESAAPSTHFVLEVEGGRARNPIHTKPRLAGYNCCTHKHTHNVHQVMRGECSTP